MYGGETGREIGQEDEFQYGRRRSSEGDCFLLSSFLFSFYYSLLGAGFAEMDLGAGLDRIVTLERSARSVLEKEENEEEKCQSIVKRY